jgi:hypothetical protein
MMVVVCGGRNYADRQTLWHVLDLWHNNYGIEILGQGGAPGADRLAAAWARRRKVPLVTYEADWSRGDRAGPERNKHMLLDAKPDVVLAFPGGKGTRDCVRQARAIGVRVVEPLLDRQPGLFMLRLA